MGKYLIKRLLLLIPTLLLVCFIVFALMRMVPGDAVDTIMSQLQASSSSAVDRSTIEAMLNLDQPFFKQFFTWLVQLLHGDLGTSFFQTGTVSSIILRKLPPTLELGILTVLLTTVISIPLGVFCAARQDSVGDNFIRVLAVILMSVPVFWIATLVLVYPAVWWKYVPPTTYVPIWQDPIANLRMFLPPALLAALTGAGGQLRNVRTLTLEVMRQDYIRTAWSKGLKERAILFRHAFRNTMIPVITMIGGSIGAILGGNVILETMFGIPGLGQQLTNSLSSRDYPVVEGCVLIMAILTMVVNLIVDICYKVADPRVSVD